MSTAPRRTAAVVAASLGTLLLTAPPPDAALRALVDAGSSTDPTGPLVAAVALLAWAATGWLTLTVTAVLLSRVPGQLGRAARTVAGRVVPASVRRAVEAALGITVAVGVITPTAALATPLAAVTAAATTTATTTTATASAVAGSDASWDLDWPGTTAMPSTAPPRPAAPVAPVTGPSTAIPVAAQTRPPSLRPPSAPPPPPRPAPVVAAPAVGVTPPVTPTAGAVVVRDGDSLWSIAEAALRRAGAAPTDRQVAQAWPRWWAANREAVGHDPDLLLPGTVLRPPAGDPGRS